MPRLGEHRRIALGLHLVGQLWPVLVQGQDPGPLQGPGAKSDLKIFPCVAVCLS